MWKWTGAFIIAVTLLIATQGPKLLLNFPELIGILSRVRDPIGENRAVTWQAGPAEPAQPASERPPNIVVILVDDLGWNDLTWSGGGVADGTVPTTHIDSLAARGVSFDAGYAGNATCAPSRAALLTGRYPQRFGFESTPAPAAMGKMISTIQNRDLPEGEAGTIFHENLTPQVPPMEEQGVPASEITLAELLRERGYRTLMLGKWHLGETEGQTPTDQGFDEFLGFHSGASLFGHEDDPEIVSSRQEFDPIDLFLWKLLPFAVRKDTGPRFEPDAYMTDYLSKQAVAAIEANRNRPFFLYLAYNAPHTPLQATREDYEALSHIDSHAERVYAAMIRALDRGVGEVLKALEDNGLSDDTVIFFSSDNGGAHYVGIPDLNAPYRGWKMTFFEGGIRSPFFVTWPSRLPAGARVASPVSQFDVFATAAAAAGAPLPADRKIDGVDLVPFARGERSGDVHDALFWRSGGLRSVRAGGWKLTEDARQRKRWLFDLSTDATERADLAAQRADKVDELVARLDAHDREIGPRTFPVLVEGWVPIDRPTNAPPQPDEAFNYWPN